MKSTIGFIILLTVILCIMFFVYSCKQSSLSKAPKGYKSVDEMMQKLAAEAVKDAEKESHIRLDYSVKSIEKVEQILGELHKQHLKDKTKVNVDGLAMGYGAYIGEVIKRSEPGSKWEKDHPVAGENSYPLHWLGGESFPCGWCYKRITNGPEDNVWHKYLLLKQDRNANPIKK